eukprot:TRINITY_DN647_c0_g1_i1.p1 TRINITY_DN647_c0_g1~~TRINITY_DN647_c0_g1_i1.p1  ORF type:complete len:528 (+),score=106.05 TRINITY_DN647_c0_g1_i1:68-1585(+)
MLAAALLALAASVIDGGDFEIPRVTMHREYRPQFPWSSLHTAVAPYQQVDGSAGCSAQRQFLVCKRNRCWVNVRVRTQPGRVYRVRYSVDEQVFDGCVPAYCATLAASAPKPIGCLPCDKPHGVNIDGDERVADEVIGAQQCEVVPVFKQMQLDFVAQGLDTSITWFPKNVSANPRGNFKLDRVSVFQVCGSDLIPVDETLDGPGREFCPPTAAPTPAPPSQAPTQQPTAQPSTGSPSVPPSTGAPSAAPSAPSATPSAPPSAAPTVSPSAPAAAAPPPSTLPSSEAPSDAPPSKPNSGNPPLGALTPTSSSSSAPQSVGHATGSSVPSAPSPTTQPSGMPPVAPYAISGSATEPSPSASSAGLKIAVVCVSAAFAVVLAATMLWRWRARQAGEGDTDKADDDAGGAGVPRDVEAGDRAAAASSDASCGISAEPTSESAAAEPATGAPRAPDASSEFTSSPLSFVPRACFHGRRSGSPPLPLKELSPLPLPALGSAAMTPPPPPL